MVWIFIAKVVFVAQSRIWYHYFRTDKPDVHDAAMCDAFPLKSKKQEGESIPMKKTTLLSLVTAAAVVTTSVGTFAAYDILTANNTGNGATLDFGSPSLWQ